MRHSIFFWYPIHGQLCCFLSTSISYKKDDMGLTMKISKMSIRNKKVGYRCSKNNEYNIFLWLSWDTATNHATLPSFFVFFTNRFLNTNITRKLYFSVSSDSWIFAIFVALKCLHISWNFVYLFMDSETFNFNSIYFETVNSKICNCKVFKKLLVSENWISKLILESI